MDANTQLKSAQIFQFPKHKVVTSNPIEIIENLHDMKLESIDDAMDFLIPQFLTAYEMAGFKGIENPKMIFAMNLVRACMFDHFGMFHPLDEFMIEHHDDIQEAITYEESVDTTEKVIILE